MKILKKGTLLHFDCTECGCVFAEGVKTTKNRASRFVWDPNRQQHITYMECPCCGAQVIGCMDPKPISEDKEEDKVDG